MSEDEDRVYWQGVWDTLIYLRDDHNADWVMTTKFADWAKLYLEGDAVE